MRVFLTKAAIARQKFPEQLEIVPALPKNPSGKVRKFELRDSLIAGRGCEGKPMDGTKANSKTMGIPIAEGLFVDQRMGHG